MPIDPDTFIPDTVPSAGHNGTVSKDQEVDPDSFIPDPVPVTMAQAKRVANPNLNSSLSEDEAAAFANKSAIPVDSNLSSSLSPEEAALFNPPKKGMIPTIFNVNVPGNSNPSMADRIQQFYNPIPSAPSGTVADAVIRGGTQGLTLGFGDELQSLTGPESLDSIRQKNELAHQTHPYAYSGSKLAGGAATALLGLNAPGLVAKGIGGLATQGAGLGAIQGLGETNNKSDVAETAGNIAGGAATGALLAGILGIPAARFVKPKELFTGESVSPEDINIIKKAYEANKKVAPETVLPNGNPENMHSVVEEATNAVKDDPVLKKYIIKNDLPNIHRTINDKIDDIDDIQIPNVLKKIDEKNIYFVRPDESSLSNDINDNYIADSKLEPLSPELKKLFEDDEEKIPVSNDTMTAKELWDQIHGKDSYLDPEWKRVLTDSFIDQLKINDQYGYLSPEINSIKDLTDKSRNLKTLKDLIGSVKETKKTPVPLVKDKFNPIDLASRVSKIDPYNTILNKVKSIVKPIIVNGVQKPINAVRNPYINHDIVSNYRDLIPWDKRIPIQIVKTGIGAGVDQNDIRNVVAKLGYAASIPALSVLDKIEHMVLGKDKSKGKKESDIKEAIPEIE